MTDHPALFLLLSVGLLQFWLMPAVAWTLLRGQRDTAANFWFAGTACYAGTVTLFIVQTVAPNRFGAVAGLGLVLLMLAFFAESLRRELVSGRTRWTGIAAVVASCLLATLVVQHAAGPDWARVTQLVLVSVLDAGCCVLLGLVIHRRRSRALLFVLAGFLVVIVTNALRVHAFLARGDSPLILTYSPTANLGFIANYLSVVVYSFGYWGFVVEKNRAALIAEVAERTRAQEGESQALDRERTTQELIRQREQLIEQLAQAQRAAEAGALSASIAHELNQPLASVRLSIEEAVELQQSGGDPGRLGLLLARIAEENQRAARMIRRLRDVFSRRQVENEPRSLDEIVAEMCELLRRRAVEMRVDLRTVLAAPVKVEVGAGELEHVVLNLVTNAIDALSASGVERPAIVVSTTLADTGAILGVRDNGPGIGVEIRERLFDLFSGGHARGMGLGLWLSRHIVERHGGRIALDPDDERPGASFTVTLPLERERAPA